MIDKELIDRVNKIYWQYNVGPQTVKKPRDLAVLTSMCAFGKNTNRGPIGITRCLFNDTEEVTLVLLGGTQIKEGQATTFKESKLSMNGKDNDYLTNLLDLFNKKGKETVIPKDKPIIITGISLGGMIAQQLLSKPEIIDNYNIKSIICFGSPLTKPLDRKGTRIIRFQDKNDIVPKMGFMTTKFSIKKKRIAKKLNAIEAITEDGEYKTRIESHALSYVENKKFDKYDFYGVLGGKNKLELLEEIKFYEAPIIK